MIWCACFGLPYYCCCDSFCVFFYKAHFSDVYNFIAGFALVLLCRAVESLWVWGVTTSSTLLWISAVWLLLLQLPLLQWLIPFGWIGFLTTFILVGWQASKVVSQYVDMSTTFHVWCMLFHVFDSGFTWLRFLAICCTFAAGYCAKSVFPSLTVLAINAVSDIKNQRHLWRELQQFLWGTHTMVCVLELHYTIHWYFCCLVWKMLTDQI